MAFAGVYLGLFLSMRFLPSSAMGDKDFALFLVIIRNVFILLKIFSRFRKLSSFVNDITIHPAQTIVYSFFAVILVGALILMMPFTSSSGVGLSFLDSLFTATSAVCVTGLVVVDTAVHFSPWGQAVIMILIQVGGLGIMILSFFTIYVLGKSLSLESKMLLSYMIEQEDMKSLNKSLLSIITITVIVELAGALIIFGVLRGNGDIGFWRRVFVALFHSVSAFCNAGFALYSDSLEIYRSNPTMNLAISLLIISGGLSFMVMTNLSSWITDGVRNLVGRRKGRQRKLSPNTKLVLSVTGVLLLSGTMFFYFFEHGETLAEYDLGTQYLAALFQSVSLRTAGFNTVNLGALQNTTLLIMILYMFIGGAAGSTAGGVKVNTLGVIFAYIRSLLKNEQKVIIYNHELSLQKVTSAFLVLMLAFVVVLVGLVFLLAFESFSFVELLFESVSAFATVGLSTGITPGLSGPGKTVVIILMFIGRCGPLTMLVAGSRRATQMKISYPQANISVG